MNILFTSHRFYPDIGGVETVSDILAKSFVNAGNSVRVLTNSKGNSTYDKQIFPFDIIREPSTTDLVSAYYWADLVFQNNLEVRHLWPIIFIRKPLVIALHTWIRSVDGKRTLRHLLKRLSLYLASTVVSCSEAIRQDTFLKSIVIGNPYRDELFRIDPCISRDQSIVFLGRLVSDKGVDLLLRTFASINRPDWKLSIIGDGPELSRLKKLASSLKILNLVTFLGPLQGKNLVRELNRHEIMVVPSLWREPFGLVVLEGLAAGCVILASDGGGLQEATGSAGLLFKRGDQTDFIKKLRTLIDDVQLRFHLRSLAPIHLSKYSQKSVCMHYLDVLEKTRSS